MLLPRLLCHSMNHAIIKLPMLWMPTKERQNLIQVTLTSRRVSSFSAPVVAMAAHPQPRLSQQMYTLKRIKLRDQLALNGEALHNNRRLEDPLLLPKVPERIGLADSLTLILRLNLPIHMKDESLSEAALLPLFSASLALSKNSKCVSHTQSQTGLVPRAVAHHRHPPQATSTRSHHRLLLSLKRRPRRRRIGELLTPTGAAQPHRHRRRPRAMRTGSTLLLMAWPHSVPTTALVLMDVLFTIIACLPPSPPIPSTRHHLPITPIIPIILHKGALRMDHRRLLLLCLRHLLNAWWMIDLYRSVLRGCVNGKMNLLPRSRQTRKIVPV